MLVRSLLRRRQHALQTNSRMLATSSSPASFAMEEEPQRPAKVPIVARLRIPERRAKPTQRIICVSMNQGYDFLPRVETLVRINASLPNLEIGEAVDYMELKREANGNFIWFIRMRLPDSELPYLLCQKPLRSKGSFNPISWSAFGAPLRFPDGFRPGKDLPNIKDPKVLNALTSPNDLLAALERGKISRPHRRRQWEPIDFQMLETPVTLFVHAEDSEQFITEVREYLDLPPPKRKTYGADVGEGEEDEDDEEEEVEFGLSNSGRVALNFACATEALMMYDILDKKRMAPRIKVFHSAAEVEQVIQNEHGRIASQYMEEKLNFIPPTFDTRLEDYDPETLESFLHNEIDEMEHDWELTEEEQYGRFVIESQIAMRNDPEISRIEINPLQVATMQCTFDMKDPDLFRQNKRFSGSIKEMLEPVHEPVMPRVTPDDSFFKLPI